MKLLELQGKRLNDNIKRAGENSRMYYRECSVEHQVRERRSQQV